MPQKRKAETEDLIKFIDMYIRNQISRSEAAKKLGIAEHTLAVWIRRYKTEGIEGVLSRKNRSYTPKLKIAAVLDYLNGHGSLEFICGKYHISNSRVLGSWIKLYNEHGDFNSVKHSGGGSYMKQGRNTTKEERIEIAKKCLESGKNYGSIALKYKVSYQQARNWTKRFEALGEAGLEDRRGQRKKDQSGRTKEEEMQIEMERLKHELYMAKMEIGLLKKLKELERRDASLK